MTDSRVVFEIFFFLFSFFTDHCLLTEHKAMKLAVVVVALVTTIAWVPAEGTSLGYGENEDAAEFGHSRVRRADTLCKRNAFIFL